MKMRNYEASSYAEEWRRFSSVGLEDQLDREDRKGKGLGLFSSFRCGKLGRR